MKNKITLLFASLLFSTVMIAQEKPKQKLIKFDESSKHTLVEAKQLINNYLKLSTEDDLVKIKTKTDELGYTHETFQQYFKGVKVEFATYTAHANNGSIKTMNGQLYSIKNLDVSPSLSNAAGLQNAMTHVGAEKYLWEQDNLIDYRKPEGELVVFPALENISKTARLVYKFDIYAEQPLYRADVYVDAHTGEIVFENNKIHHANTPATGASLYNGTVSFTADSNSGSYRLRQTADGNGIQTFDMNNGTNYNTASDITSGSTSFSGNETGVQAHWGAEQTHQYFFQNHGRNSFDNNGTTIKSYVSYSSNYVNAFWDGSRMTYGDGDGVDYGPLVSLDIVGHEITHGVTEYSANLVYSYESGALNESFSDIFGESIEFHAQGTNDWLMGDQIGAGGSGGALRSMSNPNIYNQPDTYLGTSWYSGSGDNGGVHYNSGVQNFWFYLLSEGGSGTNDNGDAYSVAQIGMDAAAAIAYRNLTVYLNSSSQYSDARVGAIQSAIDLYGAGSVEEIAVTNAWYAVGVGAAYDDGSGGGPGVCHTGDVTLSLTFDNYPEETSWTLKDSSGATVDSASYSTSNPDGSTVTATFSGLSSGDYTFTINDSYGDGICCSYGNGSYTLTSSEGTIVSGGSFGSSEATVFCLEDGGMAPDTEAPTAPTNLTVSNITQTTATLSWSASTDNIGVTEYEVFSSGTSIGRVTGTSASITGLTASTTYSYTVKALDEAGNVSSASNTATFTTLSNNVTYCASQGNNSSYEWIDYVAFGGMSNSSGNDGGYADYTSQVATVASGSTNQITISAGFSSSSYTEYWAIWIDLNQNGTFETGEKLVSGSSASAGNLTADVVIPSSASLGQTRMRVSMKYNASQTACESFTYGEVEDYTVNITNQLVGATVATNDTVGNKLGEENKIFDFSVYPNPVNNDLNIRLNDTRSASYTINNIFGQVVTKGNVNSNSIDVSKLSAGTYVLVLNDGQKQITKKFIKL